MPAVEVFVTVAVVVVPLKVWLCVVVPPVVPEVVSPIRNLFKYVVE